MELLTKGKGQPVTSKLDLEAMDIAVKPTGTDSERVEKEQLVVRKKGTRTEGHRSRRWKAEKDWK